MRFFYQPNCTDFQHRNNNPLSPETAILFFGTQIGYYISNETLKRIQKREIRKTLRVGKN